MHTFWNNIKTTMLLALMFGIILAAGAMFGKGGLIIAFVIGGAGTLISFFYSDQIAIKSMRGKQVDRESAYDLVTMIERLAKNAGLPMPKVYICPQQAPNAFATGRGPHHAAVAVTQGALRLLDYDELEGVMAHELSHVKNRDTLISTVAATIAGAISFLGWIFMFGGRSRDVNPLVALAFVLLAPVAAAIIQMAISRSREYVADADGAAIAGTPHGLINALNKLENMNNKVPMESGTPAQNHMFIVKPLNGGGEGGGGGGMMSSLSNLFRTHPKTEERIAKLRELG